MSTPARSRALPLARRLTAPLLLSVTMGLAPAQSSSSDLRSVEEADSTAAMILMADRDRESIHPGDALRVQGVMTDGNDIRSGLRALSRGGFEPLQVDARDAYQRRLAMLESGVRYDTNVARPFGAPRGEALPPGTRRVNAHGDVEETSEEEEGGGTTWIGLALAAVATVVYFVSSMRTPGLS